MPVRTASVRLLAACAAALLGLVLLAPHALGGLLFLVPALLLLALLSLGRYVGARQLERLRRSVRRATPRRAPAVARGRRFVAAIPRGGRLIATSLAVRPPPSR